MKRFFSIALVLGGVIVMSAVACWAQSGGRYGRVYDRGTVETITGEVMRVDRIESRRGRSSGIHLVVKTESETIVTHLGPAWYIDKQPFQIARGDKIRIKGSRVKFDNRDIIIAAEIKKGDAVLHLREENGVPNWRGWRRP